MCTANASDVLGCQSCPSTNLPSALIRALTEAWTRDAQAEHASIGSFARVTLQLLSVGAPSELVLASQRAGMEEVLHARFALSVASAYAGMHLSPGKFPLPNTLPLSSSLYELALSTGEEGCLEETLSAVDVAVRAAAAEETCLSKGLSLIADDEGRHAALAWATVAWTLREISSQDFSRVAAALQEMFAKPYFAESLEQDLPITLARISKKALQARRFVHSKVLSLWLEALVESKGTLAELPYEVLEMDPAITSSLAVIRAEFARLNAQK